MEDGSTVTVAGAVTDSTEVPVSPCSLFIRLTAEPIPGGKLASENGAVNRSSDESRQSVTGTKKCRQVGSEPDGGDYARQQVRQPAQVDQKPTLTREQSRKLAKQAARMVAPDAAKLEENLAAAFGAISVADEFRAKAGLPAPKRSNWSTRLKRFPGNAKPRTSGSWLFVPPGKG
jgi:hypothetical protein